MFYEIQFKLGKVAQLTEASLSSTSIPSIENIRSAAIIFDEYKNCLFLNDAAEKIFGDRSDISIIGDWIREQIKNDLQQPRVFKLQELPILAATKGWQTQIEVVLCQQDISQEFWQELNQHKSLAIREPKIKPVYTRETEVFLPQYLSTNIVYDRLTGLPNYNLLLESIEQEISFCQQRVGYEFAVLFVDVNRFKVINSSLGRILGDRLLIAIAKRLQTCLRSQDFIARMGNDEFVILLSNVEQLNYAMN